MSDIKLPFRKNLTGKKFGNLTVTKYAGRDTRGNSIWICQCECGGSKTVSTSLLGSKKTQSCGCFKTGPRAHGHTSNGTLSSEYMAWRNLKNRCNNPDNPQYKQYGARGIKVCERWSHSFDKFLEDMGNKPSPQHSIDRRDNNGNYEPGNCWWATKGEQSNNTRNNVVVTIDGNTKTIKQWIVSCGLLNHRAAIYGRIAYGWNPERAITTPIAVKPRKISDAAVRLQ